MPVLVVAAALIDVAGRVLMAQRPAHRQHGGLWEFPGGKVEPGETPVVALRREMAEELGIRIDLDAVAPLAFAESPGDPPIVLLLYRCTAWRGEPAALDAAAIRWMAVDALGDLAMPPADVPLAAVLAAQR